MISLCAFDRITSYSSIGETVRMKLPYSWLAECVDGLPDPGTVAEQLILRGFEIEDVESPGALIQDVVVGQVLELKPHPNADKLTYCQVTDGAETYPIVCGAKNHKEGDCIALARVGCVLPGDFKIEKRKIRGEVSMGMMCSTRELGLGDDHEGILILDPGAPLGTKLVDYLDLNDVIFDISITPNRPDVLSAVGMAREAAAACGGTVRMPDTGPLPPDVDEGYAPSVTLEADDLCPRYTALVLKNLSIRPSPEWLKKRLEACGIRSINNVVDATNLVLMELGQPLHAFDLSKLKDERIVVRRAKPGEPMRTLDGEDRTLTEDMLVICDAENPVALAGVMGGEDSEVSDSTTSLLLESAFFAPASIRRTSRAVGLSSEASYRFERGVDLDMVIPAAWRCARLIQELAGGTIAGDITIADTSHKEVLKDRLARPIRLRFSECDRRLGSSIPRQTIMENFKSILFEVTGTAEDHIDLLVPSFRFDVQREADLIEEVARCVGYDQFEPTVPMGRIAPPEPTRIERPLLNALHTTLTNAGFDEAITYTYTAKEHLIPFAKDAALLDADVVTIQNPINVDERTMQCSLLPSLLLAAKRNIAHGNSDFGLYEVSKTFEVPAGDLIETNRLAGVMLGRSMHDWRQSRGDVEFYDLKGFVERLLQAAGVSRFRVSEGPSWLHPHRGCLVVVGKTEVGAFGELHPELAITHEIPGRVCVFEFNLEALNEAYKNRRVRFKPFSAFPAVKRDLAFLLPEGVSAEAIEKTIRKQAGELLEDVSLFDYYKGKQVEEGFASVAFRVSLRSETETLTDEKVESLCSELLSTLQSKLNVRLRA